MGGIFSLDNPLMQGINKIIDCIFLSILWVLFGILSGSSLFGIVGMVIAMPLLVSIKIIYQVYKEHHQNKLSY